MQLLLHILPNVQSWDPQQTREFSRIPIGKQQTPRFGHSHIPLAFHPAMFGSQKKTWLFSRTWENTSLYKHVVLSKHASVETSLLNGQLSNIAMDSTSLQGIP